MERPGVTIHYLGHHPGCADRLGEWSWAEWRQIYDQRGQNREHALKNYRERVNIDKIPIALIALNSQEDLIGTVSLKSDDLELRPELTTWLGGLYVLPKWRRRGVGSLLMQRAIEEARRLKLATLHLWTPSAEKLYTRLSWSVVERMDYRGKPIVLMQFSL